MPPALRPIRAAIAKSRMQKPASVMPCKLGGSVKVVYLDSKASLGFRLYSTPTYAAAYGTPCLFGYFGVL